jgi:hypothetical protein
MRSASRGSHDDDRDSCKDQIKHFRRLLLAERKRLEERRAASFGEMASAIRRFAHDEIGFVKTLVVSPSESEDGDMAENDVAAFTSNDDHFQGDGQARSHVEM